MSESDLTTTDYYLQAEADRAASNGESATTPGQRRAVSGWERANAQLSRVLAFVLVVVVTFLVVGYAKTAKKSLDARPKNSMNSIDWLLWFGGAKEGQTFEKYIKDTTEKNQREWDEKYRNSPASQFSRDGVDWSKMQSNFDASFSK